MSRGIRFPIRLKILVTLLFLISVVVGVITFTMTRSFHEDKAAYIHDPTSSIALHTAADYGHERIVAVLLAAHADAGAVNNSGITPLDRALSPHVAWVPGPASVARTLLAHGGAAARPQELSRKRRTWLAAQAAAPNGPICRSRIWKIA